MNISETSFPARDRMNDRMVRQVRYTGPASYVTGGDPLAAADLQGLGMAEVYTVVGEIGDAGGAASANVRILHFDYANQKLQWFSASGTQVANAADLSGFSGVLTFYGKG